MKTIPPDLQADLDAGSTTLCHCWRVERADDTVLGFTDHDEDVTFGSVAYKAATGMTASAVTASLGLNVDGAEAAGALVDDALTEDDLARGLWDGAAVTLFLVDWKSPDRRVILFAGSIGEVSRGRTAFVAELRSLSHALNQERGRLYQRRCDADLGDSRCGVDLDDPSFRGTGAVDDLLSSVTFTAAGLGGFTDGLFSGGLLTWTSGANGGLAIEIKVHTRTGGETTIDLVQPMPDTIESGDGFTITAGCNKIFSTCKRTFDNVVNFRGFPHMPGNDWLASPPRKTDDNDGGPLFRGLG